MKAWRFFVVVGGGSGVMGRLGAVDGGGGGFAIFFYGEIKEGISTI